MSRLIDLSTIRFPNLIVKSRANDHIESNGRRRVMWNCICDCGNTVTVSGDNLKKGASTSCGCVRSKVSSVRNRTHGETKTRLYSIWCAIKSRCNNPSSCAYKDYGMRGIIMCDQWENDFKSFRDWSYNNGYGDNLSIDRIDNNGNYSPDNCRWVDSKTQANNRRSNIILTYSGETHNVTEWATILNKSPKTLFNRLYSGWSTEQILTT